MVNTDGFGDSNNGAIESLEVFGDHLYAGATNYTDGAQIWRTANGTDWTAVSPPGFGSAYTDTNPVVFDMVEFGGYLYAGTGSWSDDGVAGQIWRSSNGTAWGPVTIDGFGDSDNIGITTFGILGNGICAATYDPIYGLEIWCSLTGNSSEWYRVASNGYGNGNNKLATGMIEYIGYLYVAVENQANGAEIWSTQSFIPWILVSSGGFGDINNVKVESLVTHEDWLYAVTGNSITGMEVWRSRDGSTWTRYNTDGFGDANNTSTLWSNASAEFQGDLYIGTRNFATGGEVWRLQSLVYLPLVVRND